MSDPTDIMTLATHGGAGVAGAGFVGAFMRWIAGKEAAEAREEFIGLRHDVRTLLENMKEHRQVFESVVEMKSSLKALHTRLDEFERRVERIEGKRRR